MRSLELLLPGDVGSSPAAARIVSGLEDQALIYVFPTQIAADSWAEAALGLSGQRCVDLDRFIGWDSFLKNLRSSSIPAGHREADPLFRLLWAHSLLQEQEKDHSLRRITSQSRIPPSSFVWSLASAAPFLPGAAANLQAKTEAGSLPPDADLVNDYLQLAASYARFLQNHKVYEPSSLPLRGEPGKRFLLFYPQLMPGFNEALFRTVPDLELELWEPETSNAPPNPASSGSPATHNRPETIPSTFSSGGPLLLSFSSLRDELECIFSNCRALLDRGVRPPDLAISLPSLGADIMAHVSRSARAWGVPLQYRYGKALADSPIGRLAAAVVQALAEGFSQRSLRALFDPSLAPWKDRESCLSLLRLARRYRIPEFSADPAYMQTLWSKTIRPIPGSGASAASFFQTLRRSCTALAGARSFASLATALHGFIGDLLDEENFSTHINRTLERIFDELSVLQNWEKLVAAHLPSLKPIEIFLIALQHRLYTPAESAEAVSVYPYHLGIMSAAALHFVIETSLHSVSTAISLLSRAPEEISPPKDESSTADALFGSMNLVKAVYCHAVQSLEGYSAAHPYFSRNSAQKIAVEAASIAASPETAETQAWRNQEAPDLPGFLSDLALDAALGRFGSPGLREKNQVFPPPLFLDIAVKEPARPAGKPRLDASLLLRLKAFNAAPSIKLNPRGLQYLSLCPFRWLLSGIPDTEEEIADPAILAEGSLMHDMIRSLLQEDHSENSHSSADAPPEERIKNAFQAAVQRVLKRDGPSLEIALESAYPKIHDRIGRILAYEEGLREEGWVENDFERVLSMELPGLGLRLEGRADRVAFQAGRAAFHAGAPCLLIDYKRKRCPTKKEFLTDESGKVQDFQINAYAAMLESAGATVLQALYWSIEDNKAVIVFGSGKFRPDRQSFEPERNALRIALNEASERIRQGRFLDIRPSKLACTNCPAKAICRTHFSAERS